MQKKNFALSKNVNTFSLCQSKATLPKIPYQESFFLDAVFVKKGRVWLCSSYRSQINSMEPLKFLKKEDMHSLIEGTSFKEKKKSFFQKI